MSEVKLVCQSFIFLNCTGKLGKCNIIIILIHAILFKVEFYGRHYISFDFNHILFCLTFSPRSSCVSSLWSHSRLVVPGHSYVCDAGRKGKSDNFTPTNKVLGSLLFLTCLSVHLFLPCSFFSNIISFLDCFLLNEMFLVICQQ